MGGSNYEALKGYLRDRPGLLSGGEREKGFPGCDSDSSRE
jgi:hypothetical protein